MLKRKFTEYIVAYENTGELDFFYYNSLDQRFSIDSLSPVKSINIEDKANPNPNPDFYDKEELQNLMDECQKLYPSKKPMLFARCSNPSVISSISILKLKKRAFWLDFLGSEQAELPDEQKHSLFIELDGDIYKSDSISELSLKRLSAKFYDPASLKNDSRRFFYLYIYEYIGDKRNSIIPILKIRLSLDSKVAELCNLNKGKLSGTRILQEIFEYFMGYFKPRIIVLNDDARIGTIQLRVLLRIMGRKSFYEDKAGFEIVEDDYIEGYNEPGFFVRQNKAEINKAAMFLQEFSLKRLIAEFYARIKSEKKKSMLERIKNTYVISSDKLKDFVGSIYDSCRRNKEQTDLRNFWDILEPELIHDQKTVRENEFYSNMAVLFSQTSILARESKTERYFMPVEKKKHICLDICTA
jgi:hypothetical protein